jgi:IclR family transcriptional regulator, KDG regulon repressor
MPDATTSRAPKRTAAGSKNPAERKSGGIQSIRRACALLETVARSPDGIGLADLSRALGLHTSTTFHIAKTLLTLGYLRQMEQSRFYRIGRPLFALASAALDEVELISAARPVLADLANATGETSYFGVMTGEKLVVLAKHDGSGAIRINDRIGNVRPLHCTALGKVMLSTFEPAQFEAFLRDTELPIFTGKTIRTVQQLRQEIAEVRRCGVAFDDGEVSEELRCAAVPVFNFTNQVIGSLGISGPGWRLSIQALHKNTIILQQAAEQLSSELGARHGHHTKRPDAQPQNTNA